MKCLRCHGEQFIKAQPFEMKNDHLERTSVIKADMLFCMNCGHVEIIVPEDQLRQQLRYINEDIHRYK